MEKQQLESRFFAEIALFAKITAVFPFRPPMPLTAAPSDDENGWIFKVE
ncbi:hypothetical protein [Paenibacillus sp. 32O-W]|nr:MULTISPECIES: hypothetical protein [Paenibacillaceae]